MEEDGKERRIRRRSRRKSRKELIRKKGSARRKKRIKRDADRVACENCQNWYINA